MLKELRTQHRTIIQMSFNGFKNTEIAEKLGMVHSTVSTIINSPLGKAYLGGLHDRSKENTLDVRKKLIAMNSDALSAFERILSPTEKAPYSVQFSTAKDILDRNGYKPTDKINIDMTLKAKSDEEIDAEIAALAVSITANQKIKTEEFVAAEELAELAEADAKAEIAAMISESNDQTEQTEQTELLENLSIDVFPPK